MPNGLGYGRGRGFGFRGMSPPWPYVGRGRGGLPRCGYFRSGAAGAPAPWPYKQAPYFDYSAVAPSGAGQAPYPFYGGAPAGATPYAPQMSREQEIGFLKSQAEAIKGELEQIESRVRDLEAES